MPDSRDGQSGDSLVHEDPAAKWAAESINRAIKWLLQLGCTEYADELAAVRNRAEKDGVLPRV